MNMGFENQHQMPEGNWYVIKTKFFMQPGEHIQHYRPMVTTYSDSIRDQIMDATYNRQDAGHLNLAGVTGQLLSPSAESHGHVHIDEGWDARRFAFFAELVHDDGLVKTYYLASGFTDYAGYQLDGAGLLLDTEMAIEINNLIELRSHTRPTRQGNREQISRANSQTVIRNQIVMPNGGGQLETSHAMRPQDALTCMIASSLDANAVNVNPSSRLNRAGTTSDVREGLPNRWLANTMQAHLAASEPTNDGFGGGMVNQETLAYSSASRSLANTTVDKNRFMSNLLNRTSMADSGRFMWGEFLHLFPDAENDEICDVTLLPDGTMDNCDHTEHWGGDDRNSKIAVCCASFIPPLLQGANLQEYGVFISNNNVHGELEVTTSSAIPVSELVADDLATIQRLESLMRFELVPLLGFDEYEVFTLEITARLSGFTDTIIQLGDDDFPVPRTVPSYASAALTMMQATSDQHLHRVSVDVKQILDENQSVSQSPNILMPAGDY